ncbi:MAG TPA: PSD1 and planctomycete cytochrome C domain-containing protein [Candidatus Limnocylindria bacterium]|jgi:hypothetical protein|nr:PSD1 and planctomycete cytochrome C domain-containing protein [Candidatus Limnocylindria bacterium]
MKAFSLAGLLIAVATLAETTPDPAKLAFFETKVRPVLSEHCYKCHSGIEGKSKGDLTLDTRGGWEKGGEHGPAIVPGKPDDSVLFKAITYTDPDLRMPPKKEGGKLSDADIGILRQWIAEGAADPREGAGKRLSGMTPEARAHWAFQSLHKPAAPVVKDSTWPKTDIDRFVLAKLESNQMTPNGPAEKEALLRRASYDLIGLPPSVDEINAFLADTSPKAFEKVIDRLLDSPQYGERWARHWLDSARYSDTTGLVGDGGKSRFADYRYEYAWTYRDYVIRALNEDKPYNQFLMEQLAADQLPGVATNDWRLAALGFITVGKRFENPDDQIDEQIDTTTKAMLGLTVSCARCHDHKFDPIPTADYYSLHGVFANLSEPIETPEIPCQFDPSARDDFEQKLADLEKKNRDILYSAIHKIIADFQARSEGYLMVLAMKPRTVERSDVAKSYHVNGDDYHVKEVLRSIRLGPDNPVFGPYARLARLSTNEFAEKAPETLAKALSDHKVTVNRLVAEALVGKKPQSLREVAQIYAGLMSKVSSQTAELIRYRRTGADPAGFSDPAVAELIESACVIPSEKSIETTEKLSAYLSGAMAKKSGQAPPPFEPKTADSFIFSSINQLRLTHPGAPGRAMLVADKPKPAESYIYIRGNRNKKGAAVPRRFLEILSEGDRQPFTHGSGRLDLARAIGSPSNPLTARVAVNRIWMHHFGEGIVRTADDFGNMADKPSHPELLDYLAAKFIEDGWSMKKLHKEIMLSAVYQLGSDNNPAFEAKDPGNRLLWRANVRRLDFEAIRDSLVLLTGEMDQSMGGKPVNLTDEPYSYRRSIYGYVDRRKLSDLMSQFDFSDPEMANTRRISTIVPQQALFFMNSPMSVDVARHVMDRAEVGEATNDDQRVTAIYRVLFQRKPQAREILWAREFIARAEPLHSESGKFKLPATASTTPRKRNEGKKPREMKDKYAVVQNQGEKVVRANLTAWESYTQALLCSNEFAYIY